MSLRERYNDTRFTYSIKVLWDRYAARGFFIALLLMFILLFWFSQTSIVIEPYKKEVNYSPIILLNFGEGDGTGRSKGNLAKEGAKSSGAKPQNQRHRQRIHCQHRIQFPRIVYHPRTNLIQILPKDRVKLSEQEVEMVQDWEKREQDPEKVWVWVTLNGVVEEIAPF